MMKHIDAATVHRAFRQLLISGSSLLAIGILLLTSMPVQALTPQERWHYANLDISFIDDPCTATGTGDFKVLGKDNIEWAFRFFISKGLTAAQAAGIVGNLRQESNVNPSSNNTAAKPTGIDPGSIIPGETWNGGGIAQWEGGRWTGPSGLLNYVAGKRDFSGRPQGDGKNWKVIGIQLNFMWGELTGIFPHNKQPGLAEVKKTTTVADAAVTFSRVFERPNPSQANEPRRISLAQEVMALAIQGGWVNQPVNTDVTNSGLGCGAAASVGAGAVDVNGYAFPLAPQTKKNYGTMPCNNAPSYYTDKYGHAAHIPMCHHDNTPAYDLMDGNGGSAVYALTDGKIINVGTCYSIDQKNPCADGCTEIQFQANHGSDHYFYWYGHMMQPKVSPGATVQPGQIIAYTATKAKFGNLVRGGRNICYGGGPHLHIDRGCVDNGGKPQHGGSPNCREPKFMTDLKNIWSALKAG